MTGILVGPDAATIFSSFGEQSSGAGRSGGSDFFELGAPCAVLLADLRILRRATVSDFNTMSLCNLELKAERKSESRLGSGLAGTNEANSVVVRLARGNEMQMGVREVLVSSLLTHGMNS